MSSEKASRYIAQLYDARCNGQWASVPELARKVEKHAPKRKCLCLAARAGAIVSPKPTIESFRTAETQYGEAISTALQREETPQNDMLDGNVCRASLMFGMGNTELALTQIAEPLHRLQPPPAGSAEDLWMAICVLHGTLIRGLALEAHGNTIEATDTYRYMISFVSSMADISKQCSELRRWTEELLCQMCVYFASSLPGKPAQYGEAMAVLHVLSKLLASQNGQLYITRSTYTNTTPRKVWRVWYETLSNVIKDGLVYHPQPTHREYEQLDHRGLLDRDDFLTARKQQRRELKRVEASYEAILLRETTFPKASETNPEVMSWVELVMRNWQVLCGPTWTEEELGEGGKALVGRNTSDILYRAATKTFHSTQILRHLFTIHTFLAEFDLAFKAFDSYVDIITKGKARIKKSGSAGLDLDKDEDAVKLASEAILVSCRYGSHDAYEKAFEIGMELSKWLDLDDPESLILQMDDMDINERDPEVKPQIPRGLSPSTVALAYRAIGISEATWANITYDASIRPQLQQKAIVNFRKSLQENDGDNSETLFAMALILAQTRDITGAMSMAKEALQSHPHDASANGVNGEVNGTKTIDDSQYFRQRKLVPAWHLLGLLLSACEDFDTAKTSCEAAFEQFGTFSDLFGDSGLGRTGSKRGQHLQESNEKSQRKSARAVVDLMTSYEKQALISVKMTQISILEVVEGTEVAVNASHELIKLYVRMFGSLDIAESKYYKPEPVMSPPKSSSGTVRSMFRRSKHASQNQQKDQSATSVPATPATARDTRPGTTTTVAPTIQVTGEDGDTVESPKSSKHHLHLRHRRSDLQEPKRSTSLLRKKSLQNTSQRNGVDGTNRSSLAATQDRDKRSLDVAEAAYVTANSGSKTNLYESNQASTNASTRASLDVRSGSIGRQAGQPAGGARQLEPIPHNMPPQEQPAPPGHNEQPPKQDTRLPVPHPLSHATSPPPQFLALQERRQRISVLVEIWLFIARLYTKASLHTDAKEAIAEAQKLVSTLEAEVSRDLGESTRVYQERGWGGGKSIEELWADVFCEKATLAFAQSDPHASLHLHEQALLHSPNHTPSTTALSNLLLDIYAQLIPPEKPEPSLLDNLIAPHHVTNPTPLITTLSSSASQLSASKAPLSLSRQPTRLDTTTLSTMPQPRGAPLLEPPELYRLAARDRAAGLLTSLTKLGGAWDDGEAWLALARAYELSGQEEKAREALWWVVELEEGKPVGREGWGGLRVVL